MSKPSRPCVQHQENRSFNFLQLHRKYWKRYMWMETFAIKVINSHSNDIWVKVIHKICFWIQQKTISSIMPDMLGRKTNPWPFTYLGSFDKAPAFLERPLLFSPYLTFLFNIFEQYITTHVLWFKFFTVMEAVQKSLRKMWGICWVLRAVLLTTRLPKMSTFGSENVHSTNVKRLTSCRLVF